MVNITDQDFTLRCCWFCKHCKLDITRGYECYAEEKPIQLSGNAEIHINRENCKNYTRNI